MHDDRPSSAEDVLRAFLTAPSHLAAVKLANRLLQGDFLVAAMRLAADNESQEGRDALTRARAAREDAGCGPWTRIREEKS